MMEDGDGKWNDIVLLCLTTRCLFDYVLHPSATISHTTRAYIRERWKRRKRTHNTTQEEKGERKDRIEGYILHD